MSLPALLLGGILAGTTLVVSPGSPYASIDGALAAAADGDTIEVHGGVHRGPIVVDRAVTLVGVDEPVLDGGGRGTVLTLRAPGAAVRGFTIRGSGRVLNDDDAGVAVKAPGGVVDDNWIEDALHGISVENAANTLIRGNRIRGKDLPPPERGDGIRLWYSPDARVERNEVTSSRDVVIWYSADVRVVGNRVSDGRYGLHLMYDDGIEAIDNQLRDNSVGAYVMYSRNVLVRGNLLAANRGPSGYGLGLKDVDDLTAVDNWMVDNRVGIWIDGSPRSLDAQGRLHRNVVAFNDIGLSLLPAVSRNDVWENAFRENRQQISVQGGGTPRGNRWSVDGRGNYWSDYPGYDANDDGIGDVPYRSEALFGDLADRAPVLRFFQLGLAADAIEFGARAFPNLRPAPKLVDEAPLLSAPVVSVPASLPAQAPWTVAGFGAALLGLAGGVLRLGRMRVTVTPRPSPSALGSALDVRDLTRAFGRRIAVNDLSFSVAPGEAVAIWGANGAGKTTALRCILGLLPYDGAIHIAGLDARRQGRRARRALGYVPQEVALHDDLTVEETVRLYAGLRRVSVVDGQHRLEELGLAEYLKHPVGALSGGTRQRLALALALLGNPPLLLLDEPTSNLDAAGREQVLRRLQELRGRGTAILFASHRLDEVEALADRVLVLDGGKLVAVVPPGELAARLGLRLHLHLRVGENRVGAAAAVLAAAGLEPRPNGTSVGVAVAPNEKALPIRLLERAGIVVTDFDLEDRAGASSGDGLTSEARLTFEERLPNDEGLTSGEEAL